MALAYGGGLGAQRFLYEVRPDIFPQGFLTVVETELWSRFITYIKRKTK